VIPCPMRCSRATKKMEGGVKVLVLLPQILPGYVYPALFVEKGKFLHLTPGFRKENPFQRKRVCRNKDLQSIRWMLSKSESLNKSVVLVGTCLELKCILE
jgi:hypothetical protein